MQYIRMQHIQQLHQQQQQQQQSQGQQQAAQQTTQQQQAGQQPTQTTAEQAQQQAQQATAQPTEFTFTSGGQVTNEKRMNVLIIEAAFFPSWTGRHPSKLFGTFLRIGWENDNYTSRSNNEP